MSKISVVIPTVGRVETLPTVVTALSFQSKKIDEIIILDEARTPIMENYVVNQSLDVLSLADIDVKILRNRKPTGIGAARLRLVKEARNNSVLMLDDDVVLKPSAVEYLSKYEKEYNWTVPTCRLIPADFATDGYIDNEIVSPDDPRVVQWTSKYPWFVPYFRYASGYCAELKYAGTQAILVNRDSFLRCNSDLGDLGKLPREDSVLTNRMGIGLFVSDAECYHYEHKTQEGRSNWNDSVHYKLHEVAGNSPKEFIKLMNR